MYGLDFKLHGKVVEILRDYVKISVLRCVCLALWAHSRGRAMKAVLNPSGITVQATLIRASESKRIKPPDQTSIHVAAYSRSWDTPLNRHNIKQFQLLRLVLPLRFRQ